MCAHRYTSIASLALVAIVAYPVLVPVLYVFLLARTRHAIWSADPDHPRAPLAKAIHFLTEEYRQAGWRRLPGP